MERERLGDYGLSSGPLHCLAGERIINMGKEEEETPPASTWLILVDLYNLDILRIIVYLRHLVLCSSYFPHSLLGHGVFRLLAALDSGLDPKMGNPVFVFES